MNKLILGVIIFTAHFCSYANNSCGESWESNQNSIEETQSLPHLAKKVLEHFYLKTEDIVPDIDIKELEILPETDSLIYNWYNRHKDNQYYKTAIWRGKKVFLKKIKALHGEHELAVLRTFNRIGIPVLLQGVVRDTDGILYMVSKFQERKILRNQQEVLTNIDKQYHKPVYQQLREIKIVLLATNIYPMDLQFIVSEEGKVYLIDVELYKFLAEEKISEKAKTIMRISMDLMFLNEEMSTEENPTETEIISNMVEKLKNLLKK